MTPRPESGFETGTEVGFHDLARGSRFGIRVEFGFRNGGRGRVSGHESGGRVLGRRSRSDFEIGSGLGFTVSIGFRDESRGLGMVLGRESGSGLGMGSGLGFRVGVGVGVGVRFQDEVEVGIRDGGRGQNSRKGLGSGFGTRSGFETTPVPKPNPDLCPDAHLEILKPDTRPPVSKLDPCPEI
ncbi:hypothetical protein TIFTF001_050309 [Ficus carica]|uniref:Uncharacterized protein n=1 Tax=Ficus carica TaxID=3494 RepID=A0AA87YVW7_FICCA|nr:hypothetical protein TIFTF001_050309 [Ficus carica]